MKFFNPAFSGNPSSARYIRQTTSGLYYYNDIETKYSGNCCCSKEHKTESWEYRPSEDDNKNEPNIRKITFESKNGKRQTISFFLSATALQMTQNEHIIGLHPVESSQYENYTKIEIDVSDNKSYHYDLGLFLVKLLKMDDIPKKLNNTFVEFIPQWRRIVIKEEDLNYCEQKAEEELENEHNCCNTCPIL